MHGLLLVDKPEGITSFDVVRRVRRCCRTRRVGHGGTLDPLATGLLPVAVGQGTRLLEYLLDGNKTYRATLELGRATTTQDSQGEVISESSLEGFDPQLIPEALAGFLGSQLQLPPMYSALKHQGQPLYRLARSGTEVEREPRRIEVLHLELLEIDLPYMSFEIRCSKGTYVRTLIHDLGQRLGVGAHMTALRRLASGPFGLQQAVSLEELEAHDWSCVPSRGWLDLLGCAALFTRVTLHPAALPLLANGVPPTLDQVESGAELVDGSLVALVTEDRLWAVATYAPGRSADPRGDFLLQKVFPVS